MGRTTHAISVCLGNLNALNVPIFLWNRNQHKSVCNWRFAELKWGQTRQNMAEWHCWQYGRSRNEIGCHTFAADAGKPHMTHTHFWTFVYSGSLWAHFVMTSASAHRTFCQLLAYLKLPLISRVQCSAAALECSMLGEVGILSRELWWTGDDRSLFAAPEAGGPTSQPWP